MNVKQKARILGVIVLVSSGIFMISLFGPTQTNYAGSFVVSESDHQQEAPQAAGVTSLDDVEITKLTRNVEVNPFGIVIIRDTYEIKNGGTSSLSSFIVLESKEYQENHTYFRKFSLKTGEACGFKYLDREINTLRQISVYFPSPVLPDDSLTFTQTRALRGLVNVSGSELEQNFIGKVNIFPPLLITSGEAESIIQIPDTAEFKSTSPEPTKEDDQEIRYEYDNVTKYQLEPVTFAYSYLAQTILNLESIQRDIYVDTWGHLKVIESHVIRNEGVKSVPKFVVRIPEDATGVELSDSLGGISGFTVSEDVNDWEPTKNLTVNLQDNRAEIKPNSVFRYVLEYSLNLDPTLESSWYLHAFEINAFLSKYQFLGTNEVTRIILLGAETIREVYPQPVNVIGVENGLAIVYENDYVSEFQDLSVRVVYEVNAYQVLFRPLLFIFLLMVVSAAYVIVRKGMKREREYGIEEEENIPKKELREFIQLYEEKNALILEIDGVTEDIRRKKIRKKQGARALKDARSKIKDVEFDIRPLKDALLEADARIVKIVERLDYLETERLSLKDSIKLLEQRYRRGKLQSRASYERLREDLNKRIEKIQKTIDRSVSELKGFLV